MHKFCVNCNKEFKISPSRSYLKYCSIKCYNEIRSLKTICKQCNKEFKHKKSIKRIFCCTKCHKEYWRVNHISWNKGLTTKTSKKLNETIIKMSESLKKAYAEGKIDRYAITKKANETLRQRSIDKWNKGEPNSRIGKRGYKLIYHPERKWIKEHHWIWEQHNGPVPVGMHIHHINLNRLDNKIENLCLLTPSEHSKLHQVLKKAKQP